MSRRIDFYTISIHNHNGVTDYSITDFFETISTQMLAEENDGQIVRRIGDKWVRLFPYLYSLGRRQIVIPFGKLKDKNKPYWINNENQLEEIPQNLYDINSLGYDIDYNIMMFTTNREGPQPQIVEAYLNTFIPEYTGLSVKIEPIVYNTGIEKVRNAQLVKNVTLSLDLGKSLNNFYLTQVEDNAQRPLIAALKSMAESAKNDVESKTLSLTMGLGKTGKKNDTLNLDSMLNLLESINIEEDFVTEIRVNYKDGSDEKIDLARLKQSHLLLYYLCVCKETQVSPESLLGNINAAVAEKVVVITRHNRQYFVNIHQYRGNAFDIVRRWENN